MRRSFGGLALVAALVAVSCAPSPAEHGQVIAAQARTVGAAIDSAAERFGVPCDVLADGTPFNRIDNVAKGHTPLWLPDSEQQAPQFLTFVYGYTVNSAGTRTYGWINEAMIERAEKGE